MIKLFTEEEYKAVKSRHTLPLQCMNCGTIFYKTRIDIHLAELAKRNQKYEFCNRSCNNKKRCTVCCKQCLKIFEKTTGEMKKGSNHFCTKSCAAKYNNAHKTKGTRRSKLEQWLEIKLLELYPDLEFHFNKTDAINAELDIYIPSLKLAFELNGIFHYEPIYGQDKLDKIQSNDHRKFQACIEHNISLCIIDTTSLLHFKENNAIIFLNILTSILNDGPRT